MVGKVHENVTKIISKQHVTLPRRLNKMQNLIVGITPLSISSNNQILILYLHIFGSILSDDVFFYYKLHCYGVHMESIKK